MLMRASSAAAFLLFATITVDPATASAAAGKTCRAAAVLSQREAIGQHVLIGFNGTKVTDKGVKRAFRALRDSRAGGVIFFKKNIKSLTQVKALTDYFRSARKDLAPFIAVDEEGGRVQRLKGNGFANEPSAATVASRGVKEARIIYQRMAGDLARAGFNLNFGPVADVNLNPNNPVIGRLGRSFSSRPDTVAKFAKVFIDAHHRVGVLTALKHFPGHGSSRADTHKQFTDVTKVWRASELIPYQRLAGNADMVMTAHIYNARWSPSGRPASLSPQVLDMLRKTMGANVVAITDDIQMKAVTSGAKLSNAIVQALKAGNDIVLIGNALAYKQDAATFATGAIDGALAEGRLDALALERSLCRIARLKGRLAPARGGAVATLPANGEVAASQPVAAQPASKTVRVAADKPRTIGEMIRMVVPGLTEPPSPSEDQPAFDTDRK